MKNFLKTILILLIICIFCVSGVISYYLISALFPEYFYDKIYASKSDKSIAQIIENSINLVSNSKPLDSFIEEHKKPSVKELTRYGVDIWLDNIDYICYSESVYGISVQEMLDNVEKQYNYADVIEDKRQNGYGEGSSVFMFIKSNGDIIPVFVSAYFYEIKTNYSFKNRCSKTANNKLHVRIDSSLKEKALVAIE